MGGVGFKDVVDTVTGVGGAVGSWMGASSQADYLNQQMQMGAEQQGLVMGLDKYFLQGGKASGLAVPGFQKQFGMIDVEEHELQREIDRQARQARQMIADNIPDGGAKLRALADLALKSQDEKGRVSREAQAKKRDLDVQLTNQYLQQAMGRQPGPSQDARMYAAMGDYRGRVADLQAIGGALGQLAGKMDGRGESGGGVEYIPQTPGGVDKTPASYWQTPKDSYVSDNAMREYWNMPESGPTKQQTQDRAREYVVKSVGGM